MDATQKVQLRLEASLGVGPAGEPFALMLLTPMTPWLDMTAVARRIGEVAKVVLTGSHATICFHDKPGISMRLPDEIATAARRHRQVLMTVGLDAVRENYTAEDMIAYRVRSVDGDRLVSHLLPVE